MAKKSILIVDDDKEINLIYKAILEEKYSLDFALNLNDAMIELKRHKPDLMILDIIVPPDGGDKFYEKIKSMPAFNDLNVLIISVLGEMEDFAKKYAPNSLSLGKPFTKKDLLRTINEIIG